MDPPPSIRTGGAAVSRQEQITVRTRSCSWWSPVPGGWGTRLGSRAPWDGCAPGGGRAGRGGAGRRRGRTSRNGRPGRSCAPSAASSAGRTSFRLRARPALRQPCAAAFPGRRSRSGTCDDATPGAREHLGARGGGADRGGNGLARGPLQRQRIRRQPLLLSTCSLQSRSPAPTSPRALSPLSLPLERTPTGQPLGNLAVAGTHRPKPPRFLLKSPVKVPGLTEESGEPRPVRPRGAAWRTRRGGKQRRKMSRPG